MRQYGNLTGGDLKSWPDKEGIKTEPSSGDVNTSHLKSWPDKEGIKTPHLAHFD